MCRTLTTGIHEEFFEVEHFRLQVVDVGGQRGERRKWVHMFQAITAILFVFALDSYNIPLEEDPAVNQMMESLKIFEEVVNSRWFRGIPLIVFMNKTDLLREKVAKVNLSVCFPEYLGGLSFDSACTFLEGRMRDLNRRSDKLYFHFTCALDSAKMKAVFLSIQDIYISHVMSFTGIL